MAKQLSSSKVSVEVYEKDRRYCASIDFAESSHSLGPAATKDEIYRLVFDFIADLRLIDEINNSNQY